MERKRRDRRRGKGWRGKKQEGKKGETRGNICTVHVRGKRLKVCVEGVCVLIKSYVWQSRVEIEHYSVAYFNPHYHVQSAVAQNFR